MEEDEKRNIDIILQDLKILAQLDVLMHLLDLTARDQKPTQP